jgi:site-specific DNA-methyltransferase (adenine-specific)
MKELEHITTLYDSAGSPFRYRGKADVVVVSTYFDPSEKDAVGPMDTDHRAFKARTKGLRNLVRRASTVVKENGFLFVYGIPLWLPYVAVYLDEQQNKRYSMVFKNWIALDIDSRVRGRALPPAHMGLLMFRKLRNKGIPPRFRLNTRDVRVPYEPCDACGRLKKDWGGKKHLRNPKGAALSDVWRDLHRREIRDHLVPCDVLFRVHRLVRRNDLEFLHIIQEGPERGPPPRPQETDESEAAVDKVPLDMVIHGDCLSFMRKLHKRCPEGVFDLAFADPPYNIEKDYGRYKDASPEREYIKWCNRWLDLLVKVLRPGGSLMVLNLPRWAAHHAVFLNRRMDLRNWIVWDALSAPSGKLMPAHYALLYYTKPGREPTFDYEEVGTIDSEDYCIRERCISERKRAGKDRKVRLNDVWWDIHRLKHRKDRDSHPCQLPDRLMERIVALTTRPGDVVFDPFCGTGRTAITARKMGRHFVTMDIDERYVDITSTNLNRLRPTGSGRMAVPRSSVAKGRGKVTKREMETSYIRVCKVHGRVMDLEELKDIDMVLADKIERHYPSMKTLMKIARRRI